MVTNGVRCCYNLARQMDRYMKYRAEDCTNPIYGRYLYLENQHSKFCTIIWIRKPFSGISEKYDGFHDVSSQQRNSHSLLSIPSDGDKLFQGMLVYIIFGENCVTFIIPKPSPLYSNQESILRLSPGLLAQFQ